MYHFSNGTESGDLKYSNFRGGNLPPVWPTVLANKLGYKLNNMGSLGDSNHQIFKMFCENCSRIEPGDLSIVEWTYMERFMMAADTNSGEALMTASPHNETLPIGKEASTNMFINRSKLIWTTEIYAFENIIDELAKAKGFDAFYWSVDPRIINGEPKEFRDKDKYLFNECDTGMLDYLQKNYGAETISDETNHLLPDQHYGERGHAVLADKFYTDLVLKGIKPNRNLI
jgi:hypothetical protein